MLYCPPFPVLSHLQRKRQEDAMIEDDDDDDDISLVSRSPSPMNDGMDVDPEDTVSKYDEFLRKPISEPVTVDTRINSSNIGFALLAKMGWSEGQPLGLSGDGRIDPIPFELKQDTLGIGRATQESMIAAEAVAARRVLDSERQIQETEEQRRAREDQVARKAAVQDEISNTLRAFYCSLCDKQFQNVAQYDEHTNSYAHHHKARFRDMQANARIKPQEDIDKRKEKERKREERELRKIAKAAGIKMPKVAGQTSSTPSASAPEGPSSMDVETPSSTQKKGGWASIGTGPSTQTTGFKKSGWATVGSSASATPPPPTAPAPAPAPPQSSGWAPVSSSSSTPGAPSSGQHHTGHTPSFRTGGWTSLDTGTTTTTNTISAQPPPPPDPIPAAPSGPPQPPPPSSGFRPVQQLNTGSSQTSRGGWSSIPPAPATSASTPPPPPTSNAQSQSQFAPAPASNTSGGPPIPKPTSSISAAGASSRASEPGAEPQRSGWQKFQAKNTKRR
ncbi:hypothetical protein NP233_g1713 [Leucocoprinus birnbaumii]|uniref:G-patch domain-containing protein n=1 Tax=Leucocoprinus birnbaumii TaxID=56174 RepID=A0AAD5W2N0_9AGAR|nr:hypothetical protein NP233_g1713 [Leucocoprinus birnbaumii]